MPNEIKEAIIFILVFHKIKDQNQIDYKGIDLYLLNEQAKLMTMKIGTHIWNKLFLFGVSYYEWKYSLSQSRILLNFIH